MSVSPNIDGNDRTVSARRRYELSAECVPLPLPNIVKSRKPRLRDDPRVSLEAGWEACDAEFRRQLMRPA